MEQVSTLSFEQVWELVKKLPLSEQLKLSQKLEQNTSHSSDSENHEKLSDLLSCPVLENEEADDLFARNKDTGRKISL